MRKAGIGVRVNLSVGLVHGLGYANLLHLKIERASGVFPTTDTKYAGI